MGISQARLVEKISLFASPLWPSANTNASVPPPPPLFETMTLDGASLYFCTTAWTTRANWSVPPPGPAVAMNSSGLVGCHAAKAAEDVRLAATAMAKAIFLRFMILVSLRRLGTAVFGLAKKHRILVFAHLKQCGGAFNLHVAIANDFAGLHIAAQPLIRHQVERHRRPVAQRSRLD